MMSSVGSASTSASTRNRSPFTAAQWQELEHQALIFKYMISGMPIPPELIYSVKRSLDSSTTSRFFPTQHPVGWGCFDMSFGRKVDPEPGRCRRTDGKKWRCSKEAFPDSKYCEKHMHRGRHRSRKPVEVAAPTPTATTNNTTTNTAITSPSISSMNRNISLSNNPDTSTSPFSFSPLSSYPYPCQNPFLAPTSTYSRTPGSDFSHQSNASTIPHLFLDSSSYSPAGKEYSRDHGIKGVDELAFFPEASGTSTSYAESYNRHLTMSSFNKGYSSESHHQSSTVSYNNQRQQEQQHCFVLGTDFKSQRMDKTVKEPIVGDTQKPLHHFFGEWPPKDADSWLDLASSTSRIPHDD